MPYFINTWRTPRPDQYLNVVKGAKESLERTGRPGNITTTVSHPSPAQTSMGVIGTVAGFPTIQDVQDFLESLWEDESNIERLGNLGALCSSSNVSISQMINQPQANRFENFDAKYVQRTFITPATGKGPELEELLCEWGDDTDLKVGTILSRNMSGEATQIRISHFLEDLTTLEELKKEIAGSPRLSKFRELIGPVPRIGLGRIYYSKRA